MKKDIDTVVVIPFGPDRRIDFLSDTLDSIYYYIGPSKKVIIVDDSSNNLCDVLKTKYPELIILKTEGKQGIRGGLYVETAKAFKYAYDNYKFKVILRLDDDSLIIGSKPEEDAIKYFESHSKVGMIGSYTRDCNGRKRKFSWSGSEVKREMFRKEWRKKSPKFVSVLRKLVFFALLRGWYRFGEHCLAAAVFISYSCIERLLRQGLLPCMELKDSKLVDDMLFGLLVKSVGLKMDNFVLEGQPLGLAWKGLPLSPQELIGKNKKIIHSVKYFKDMNEEQIRQYFRQFRK